jgi:hypothetical protein
MGAAQRDARVRDREYAALRLSSRRRGPLSIDQQGGREMARHAVSENRPLTRRQITSKQELARGVRAGERSRGSAGRVRTKGRDGAQVSSRGRQAPLVETVRSYLDVNG